MALLLAATVLMGLLLLAVALWIARGIDWRSTELIVDREDGGLLGALAGSPTVWVGTFLVFALGLTGVALLAVGDFGVGTPGVQTLAVAAIGSLVLFYLIGGTYVAARGRNVSAAGATLAATIVLGTLLLVAVAGRLLMGP